MSDGFGQKERVNELESWRSPLLAGGENACFQFCSHLLKPAPTT